MAHEHTIYALRDKRTEILSQIRNLEAQTRKLRDALASVQTTLNLFAPDQEPPPIPSIKGYFKRAEIPARCLSILRRSGEAMSVRAIAKAIIAEKGLDGTDLRLEALARTRLFQFLRSARRRGLVARSLDGAVTFWRLIGD